MLLMSGILLEIPSNLSYTWPSNFVFACFEVILASEIASRRPCATEDVILAI
jgi:hypothetical protein